MKMIAHNDVTEELPIVPANRLLEAVDQTTSIRIIADNPLQAIAPRHHMTDGTLKFDPKSPWHVPNLDAR
jgi:hypothetical protein